MSEVKNYGDASAYVAHCERELKKLQIRAAAAIPSKRAELRKEIEKRKKMISFVKRHCSNCTETPEGAFEVMN